MNNVAQTNDESVKAENDAANTNSNETKAKDESGNIEDYLSPKCKKLAQRKEQMKRELELLDEQIAQEVEQAKLKVKDDLFKLLDRNKLLEISPKVWKKHMDDIKKILCTRQISQNPYPIRVLPS
ncbi:hypothetical protein [Acinetobacter baumannii]|uniref:hypothetical protein n=2 Tax=Acinetobacter calcoaceticus/baumannii complex TaxID=909768 RepID=UPI0001F8B000|nr:hypothetical protein [Acinetobacter baumannii]ADX05367.1 Hypothetical protein ABK1_3733 [Acinetobacter baumannii 1656-2]